MGSVLNGWCGRLAPAAGAALLATTACGPDEVVIPQPPAPLAQLIAVYDQPTGTVPVDDVSMTMADAQRRIEALELGRLPDLVVEFTRRLRTRLQDADLSTDPQETPDDDVPDIDGYVNVNRVCRGWDRLATTPDPATNGRVQGTATVRDGHLEEELWGTATSCRDRVPADSPLQVNVFVDGKLGIRLEAEVPDSLASAQLLVAFEGTVGSDEQQRQLSFDFRISFSRIEVRVPVADGDIIAAVGGGEQLVLRGSNGSFTCSVQSGGCGGPE
jgi:hypothetical protein